MNSMFIWTHAEIFILALSVEILPGFTPPSDKDGDRVGELQALYEEKGGWNAESDAATLLSNLGVDESLQDYFFKNFLAPNNNSNNLIVYKQLFLSS